ncbi:MAG: LysM peptidoglycan-binding domain-containing protein [Anaerolineaceae bacterium]|nr:LysM peptidoglycan-binding domain-containing protein [Anaerolineaceae bacterium]
MNLLTLLIILTFFAVACERPLGGTDEGTTDDQSGEVTNPDQGGGTDGSEATAGDTPETTTETPVDAGTTDSTGGDTPSEDTASGDTADTPQDDSSEAGGGAGEAPTDEQSGGDETAVDTPTTDDTAAADTTQSSDDSAANTSQDTTSTTIPETHTVAAGENLYRIGLKYGISWVAIANENNLANPNILTVGQVLKLPGATTPPPPPEPTPSPQTETTYIVQAGDNLFRIGLKFGISWVQIAEANGLVNPNLIAAGDELKIPVDTPGPAPAFSHVVKPGETLFLISLQYGVAWPTIAEANNITSPYVIYVGQTLEIPGN